MIGHSSLVLNRTVTLYCQLKLKLRHEYEGTTTLSCYFNLIELLTDTSEPRNFVNQSRRLTVHEIRHNKRSALKEEANIKIRIFNGSDFCHLARTLRLCGYSKDAATPGVIITDAATDYCPSYHPAFRALSYSSVCIARFRTLEDNKSCRIMVCVTRKFVTANVTRLHPR